MAQAPQTMQIPGTAPSETPPPLPSAGQMMAPPPQAGGPVNLHSPSQPPALKSVETKSVTTTTTTESAPEAFPAEQPTMAPLPETKMKKPAKKVAKKHVKKSAHVAKTSDNLPASMSYGRSSHTLTSSTYSRASYGSADLPQLRSTLRNLFPNENVGLEMVNNSVAVTGTVTDAQTSHRIMEVVNQYVNRDANRHNGEIARVINMMQIKTNQQVMLKVRIGEIRRVSNKGFGLLTLNDLEREGIFKILAEPNLVAISGETAKFLSGGQFPVPVQGKDGTTVEYKDYGIALQFTPIVLSQNRIRVNVDSEISKLTKEGALKSGGMEIPALMSRKAKTTVELAPGESYMIAGLLQDNMKVKTGNVTALGDIPLIGPLLFGDSTNKRDETELVVAITPYLADPVKASDIRLPSDDYRTPSQLETIFFGALGSTSGKNNVQLQNPGSEPSGAFGFMTE